MSVREAMLASVGAALGRLTENHPMGLIEQPEVVSGCLAGASHSSLPKVDNNLSDVLVANMESVLMSVVRLQSVDDCLHAVEEYLATQSIDSGESEVVTPAPALAALSLPSAFSCGTGIRAEPIGIAPCIAAVAATGSVVMTSGVHGSRFMHVLLIASPSE